MYTFFKISFRHLWKDRLYSIINIIGLATGITCTLLAVLYWKDERGFDNFHKNNPNLYRITTTLIESKGAGAITVGGTGQVQGPAFKAAVPQVESYVRVMGGDIYSDVAAEEKSLHLQSLFVDSNFFNVFTFKLLRGDPARALVDVSSVVITEGTAMKFFNSIDVVGRRLQVDADPSFKKLGRPLQIAAVVQDPPKNSSLRFDILFPFSFMRLSFEDTNWLNAYLGTFVVLRPGSDIQVVERQFRRVYALQASEQLAGNLKAYDYDPQVSYQLQPITDIHLQPYHRNDTSGEDGIINGSNPVYSYVFMGIALFILLMAVINFINISIANSFKRSKEVGVRKVAGGSRRQIIMQFLSESAMLCLVSFLLSLVMVSIILPLFNNVTGKQLFLAESLDTRLLCYFAMLLAVVTILTGFYPALILSNFKPSRVLYNKQRLSGANLSGRVLVIAQFALAVFLLIATIVYYSQMNYIRTRDLGYNPANIIRTAVGGARDYKTVINIMKNELAKEPSIQQVSFGNDGYPESIKANNHLLNAQYKKIDENFLSLMQIPLKAGRNLSLAFSTDIRGGVLVNEAFVKASGLHNPVGSTITINRRDDSTTRTIAGVVKDFHFNSLREQIKPMLMYMNEEPDGGIWVKFEKVKQKEAMAALERIYKKTIPGAVYQYNFLDELNAGQYLQEQRWQQVVTVATVISLIICCLGLFGLAHLSTHRRTREIGIRKVLGASVKQVVTLLSVEFLKLVAIAFLVAVPVSWTIMHKWLQDFAYRISIGPGIFLAAGLLAVIVALAAVSFQAIRAAIANPVKSLRTE